MLHTSQLLLCCYIVAKRPSLFSHSLILLLLLCIGNIKKGDNPTFYRSPNEYFSLLQKEVAVTLSSSSSSNVVAGGRSKSSVFELVRANSVHAYVKVNIISCVRTSLFKHILDIHISQRRIRS